VRYICLIFLLTGCVLTSTGREEREVWEDSDEAKAWLAREGQAEVAYDDSKEMQTSMSASPCGMPNPHPRPYGRRRPLPLPLPGPRRDQSNVNLALLLSLLLRRDPRRSILWRRANSIGKSGCSVATFSSGRLTRDSNRYVTENRLRDDLDKNRRSGYLDRQDFLLRVSDRRDEEWEKNKSDARRL
jgi:Bucentaur or craniofacial development